MRETEDTRTSREFLTALVLLWLSGTGLRMTILAVPPVIPLIHKDLQLTQAGVGFLTALPPLLFAAAAVPGSLLIAKFGPVRTLVAGLLLTAVASALRGTASNAALLYGTTFLMGGGISIMQPSLPRVVRDWMPHRIGFGTAVYSNGLLMGELFAVLLTGPLLLPLLGGNWRLSLVAGLEEPAHLAAGIYPGMCQQPLLRHELLPAGLSAPHPASWLDRSMPNRAQRVSVTSFIAFAGPCGPLHTPERIFHHLCLVVMGEPDGNCVRARTMGGREFRPVRIRRLIIADSHSRSPSAPERAPRRTPGFCRDVHDQLLVRRRDPDSKRFPVGPDKGPHVGIPADRIVSAGLDRARLRASPWQAMNLTWCVAGTIDPVGRLAKGTSPPPLAFLG